MPGALVTLPSQITCSHVTGKCAPVTKTAKVFVYGQPVLTIADQFPVAGCAFTVPGPKPQPCVRILWTSGATKVFVNAQPALLSASVGTCWSADQIPAGPPAVVTPQGKVIGV
jgi:hypothetical protein